MQIAYNRRISFIGRVNEPLFNKNQHHNDVPDGALIFFVLLVHL